MNATHPEPQTQRAPTHAGSADDKAPWLIRATTPLANRLVRLGLPAGPNMVMTVRGRTSGQPRTATVAVMQRDGRRYVVGAYGDVQWVRNLRAAGEAAIRLDGQDVHVSATELDPAAARAFYADTLPAFIGGLPWFGRAFSAVFFRLVSPAILRDVELAAATHPVFELRTA